MIKFEEYDYYIKPGCTVLLSRIRYKFCEGWMHLLSTGGYAMHLSTRSLRLLSHNILSLSKQKILDSRRKKHNAKREYR